MAPSTQPVAIVTASNCRIGRKIASGLARNGFAVVVVYLHDQAAADAIIDEILSSSGSAVAIRADITDSLDVERLFVEAEATFGPVDVLVHTSDDDPSLVIRQAVRRLRRGGALVTTNEGNADSAFDRDLQARGISVHHLAAEPESAEAHSALEALLAILRRWGNVAESGPESLG